MTMSVQEVKEGDAHCGRLLRHLRDDPTPVTAPAVPPEIRAAVDRLRASPVTEGECAAKLSVAVLRMEGGYTFREAAERAARQVGRDATTIQTEIKTCLMAFGYQSPRETAPLWDWMSIPASLRNL